MHSKSFSVDNVSEPFGKRALTSLYETGTLPRALTNCSKDYKFSEERRFKKLESPGNGIKTFPVSDSNDESNIEKIESVVDEYSPHSLNQEARKSSDSIIQEVDNSSTSTHKLEQSPESLELDVTTDEDAASGELKGCSNFILRTKSSLTSNGSFSSSDQDQPYFFPQTRKASGSAETSKAFGSQNVTEKHSRNCDEATGFQSLQSLMDSERTEPSSIPRSKVEEQLVKFCYSEKDEQVKILQEVDELKFELQRLLTKTADGNEASAFSIKVTHFKGKVPSENRRSSLIPLTGEPRNSAHESFRPYQEKHVVQPKHEKPQVVKRHSRPFLGGAPFVICCKCYKLLQLPADFLVSTKRVHKLRCGACSEVLKYTFRPRTRSAHQTTTLKHRTFEDENFSLNAEE